MAADNADGGLQLLTGEFIFPNGDHYDGQYLTTEEGVIQRHGVGKHSSNDGLIYQGSFVNDKMNGEGTIIFPSGATYKGNFKDNLYHGTGTYSWPNGCTYVGDFSENKLEGQGTFNDAQHQQWVGNFMYKAAPGLRVKLKM